MVWIRRGAREGKREGRKWSLGAGTRESASLGPIDKDRRHVTIDMFFSTDGTRSYEGKPSGQSYRSTGVDGIHFEVEKMQAI
jgi:hypothetical protein